MVLPTDTYLFKRLEDVAKRHGLSFTKALWHLDAERINKHANVVLHNYGVRRYQHPDEIRRWIKTNPYAHIYISAGYKGQPSYLLIGQSTELRACHVAAHNQDSIGIEINEQPDGSFSLFDILVLDDVCKVLADYYGNLTFKTHRDLTGKDCPSNYDLVQGSTLLRYDLKVRS